MLSLVFRANGLLFVQTLVAAGLVDTFNKKNRYVRCYWLTAFRIESDRQLHLNLHGETLVASWFEFKMHPRGLSVVLGGRAARSGQAIP